MDHSLAQYRVRPLNMAQQNDVFVSKISSLVMQVQDSGSLHLALCRKYCFEVDPESQRISAFFHIVNLLFTQNYSCSNILNIKIADFFLLIFMAEKNVLATCQSSKPRRPQITRSVDLCD